MRALLLALLLSLAQPTAKTSIYLHVSPQVCYPVCKVTAHILIKPTEYDRAFEVSVDNGDSFAAFDTRPITDKPVDISWNLKQPGDYEVGVKVYDSRMNVSAAARSSVKIVGEP